MVRRMSVAPLGLVLILAVFIAAGAAFAVPTGAYSLADLPGVWGSCDLASGPGAPWWLRGAWTIGINGTASGTQVFSNGSTEPGSTSLLISSDGTITSPQLTDTDWTARLDAHKTVAPLTATWSSENAGTTEMGVLVKRATTYSQSDLAGTWTLNGLASGPAEPWSLRGVMTLGAGGSGTMSQVDNSGNASNSSIQVNLDANGVVSVAGLPISGYMDANKSVAVLTETWTEGQPGTTAIMVMTRKATSYSLSDLAGTWYSVSLASGPMAPWWERATWSFSADGSFTVSQIRSNGQSSSVSGSCALSSAGTVTVPGYPSFQGRLDAGKTVIAATDTWSDSTTALSVMVKLAPGVGGAMISSSSPAPLATGCLRSAPVDITFSSPVLAASAQSHFSLLAQGTTPVAGSFSWPTPGLQMRFQPSSLLPAGTVMAVRLTPGIEGGDGRVRDWSESFTFTTATAAVAPTAPTAVTIAPTAPGPENLTATATGSTDANGDSLTYQYQWSKKTGSTWGAWGNTGQTLAAGNVKIGDIWRVRARAYDGALYGPWKAGSTSVTIVSMAGLTPAPSTYNVPTTTCVFATFRWPVQQSTVTSRVQLKLGTTKVIPTVMTWVTAERKIKLRPRSALLPNTYYRINIDPGITCTSGRVLGWGENYWFKTAPATTTAAVTVAATPTAGGAEFAVNLASAATVRTVITNIAGRVIAELPERDLPSGVSSLLWNGRSSTGSKVPAGTYLVRVSASGSEGAQTSAIAPLQIR